VVYAITSKAKINVFRKKFLHFWGQSVQKKFQKNFDFSLSKLHFFEDFSPLCIKRILCYHYYYYNYILMFWFFKKAFVRLFLISKWKKRLFFPL